MSTSHTRAHILSLVLVRTYTVKGEREKRTREQEEEEERSGGLVMEKGAQQQLANRTNLPALLARPIQRD